MKFLYLWPLALLALVPVIIFMYLLKQKAEKKEVPSLFLWRETYHNIEANTPWEKLKKNWLMILQIILFLIIILALMGPFLLNLGKSTGHVILVIDNSASMNENYEGEKTRLDKAIGEACDYVKGLKNGTGMSVISSSDVATLVVSSSDDKNEVINKIKAIEPTLNAGSAEAGVEMVKTMQSQWPTLLTVCFTDSNVSMKDVPGSIVDVYKQKENVGIEYLSHGESGGNLVILAKVTNYGEKETAKEVTLYGDDQILTSQKVSLPAGESQIVYFDKVNFTGSILRAELNGNDALADDDVCYDVVSENRDIRVLLMTEKNAYIEKVLDLMEGITVIKSNDIASFDSFVTQGFDLYIFDCMMPAPEYFPQTGNVVIFDAPNKDLYQSKGEIDSALVEAESVNITQYVETMDFGAVDITAYYTPDWAAPFLTAEVTDTETDKKERMTVGFYGDYQGQKITVFGFDLHNSELPLKMEFPLLMYNIVNDNVMTGMLQQNVVYTGDGIQVNARADGALPTVTKPDGTPVQLSDYRIVFTGTDQTGVYTVSQTESHLVKDGAEFFVANFPATESFIEMTPDMNTDAETDVKKGASGDLDLKNIIIAVALALLVVEWIAYLRK
ncbi:MAG: BatA and WFA domain-containing protein [Lachnospiraceae bacterium]|nr:BatA and WFA domain-containing protein [Lachnospiraceae bacterium]